MKGARCRLPLQFKVSPCTSAWSFIIFISALLICLHWAQKAEEERIRSLSFPISSFHYLQWVRWTCKLQVCFLKRTASYPFISITLEHKSRLNLGAFSLKQDTVLSYTEMNLYTPPFFWDACESNKKNKWRCHWVLWVFLKSKANLVGKFLESSQQPA